MRLWVSFLLIVLGVFAMVFGEADDSPGLQGLGLVLIVSVLVRGYKKRGGK
jgi:uncharacterized membrane protein